MKRILIIGHVATDPMFSKFIAEHLEMLIMEAELREVIIDDTNCHHEHRMTIVINSAPLPPSECPKMIISAPSPETINDHKHARDHRHYYQQLQNRRRSQYFSKHFKKRL